MRKLFSFVFWVLVSSSPMEIKHVRGVSMTQNSGDTLPGDTGQLWEWKRAGYCRLLGIKAFQTAANQGREGMQRQGRSSQETIEQPWGRVLVLPQGININNIFELFTELKPLQREGHSLITSKLIRRPPEARLKERRPWHTLTLISNPALEPLL